MLQQSSDQNCTEQNLDEDNLKELPTKKSDIQPRLQANKQENAEILRNKKQEESKGNIESNLEPKIEQEKEIKESGKEEEILNKDLLQKSSDQNCTEQNLEGDTSLKKKFETNEVLMKQNKAVLDQNTQESKPKEANQKEEPEDAKLEKQSEEKETNPSQEQFFQIASASAQPFQQGFCQLANHEQTANNEVWNKDDDKTTSSDSDDDNAHVIEFPQTSEGVYWKNPIIRKNVAGPPKDISQDSRLLQIKKNM